MSIQEALTELKTLELRIQRGLREVTNYGAVVIGDRTVKGFDSNDKFKKKAQSNFDSIKSLIDRRSVIKNAVVKKNAEVIVEIGTQTMTLAEAINQKTYIEAKKTLLSQLTSQYNRLMNDYQQAEYLYQQKLDSHVESIVGKDQKDKLKANEEIIKFFKEANEPKLLDPIDLKTTIEALSFEIEEFEGKVDLALTKANIINDIEFEDPTVE